MFIDLFYNLAIDDGFIIHLTMSFLRRQEPKRIEYTAQIHSETPAFAGMTVMG